MSNYESIYQALKAQFTDEEIAEGYLIPADLTPDQAKESAESFRKIRLAALENRTAEDRVGLRKGAATFIFPDRAPPKAVANRCPDSS